MSFSGKPPKLGEQSPMIDYDLDLSRERYLAYVPDDYKTGNEPFGLLVFIDASDDAAEMPPGWERVLDRRKLLYIAPQRAGNDQKVSRRLGLAVLGALKSREVSRIDPRRIYVAGYSGGARIASQLAFLQSDLFRGTIQCCGVDFYQPVAQVAPRPADRPNGEYGVVEMLAGGAQAAKTNVRFVLITGSNDFRHGDILDIYHGGFEKAGFQAKLIDAPGFDHGVCTAAMLEEALAFIEGDTPVVDAPALNGLSRVSGADWAQRNPRNWPQILLRNEAEFRDNSTMSGASGFLLRLPNDAVVAATAYHLVEDIRPADLEKAITSWVMHPPNDPDNRVSLRNLAIRSDMAKPLDCVLMSVRKQGRWPSEVLSARTTRLEKGETVYLIGVPYSQDADQLVYKAKVTQLYQTEFGYELEQQVETRGFSGAPVVDANGLAVGIHLGRINQPNARGTVGRAKQLPLILDAADAR